MRIIQINSVYGHGSTGRIVKNLHLSFLDKGYESYVFFGRGLNTKDKNIQKISTRFSVLWHGIMSRLLDRHGLQSLKDTKKLINNIKRLNPDIIHLHNVHGYYLNYPTIFKYLKTDFEGQIFWTMHDCWAFTGHCVYYTHAQCDKWKTHCNDCPQKREYPKSIAKDNSYNNFEQKIYSFTGINNLNIITPSHWLKNEIEQSFLSGYKVNVLNNGVDKSIFAPIESDFKIKFGLKEKKIILSVANVWEQRKGLKYLIGLLRYLHDDEHIVVVGRSSFLEKFAHTKLLYIPQTNNVLELAKIYNAADIFFNPTLEDNYPTTNLEAISCGTPVLTFKSGGSSETIDSKLSRSTNCRNPRDIIFQIRSIISSSTYSNKLGLASTVLSFNDFTQSYDNLYKKYLVTLN